MNENEKEGTMIEETPKKRGNPNWTKKVDSVVRAAVISESRPRDATYVGNRNPMMHYVWGRKNDAIEMNDFAQKQYAPARGAETILGDPFAAVQDTTGKTKEIGDRILMCCPQELVDAREAFRVGQQVSVKDAARSDARKIGGKGVMVEPIAEEIIKRERM